MDGDGTYRHDDLLSRCGRYPVQEGRADSLQDCTSGEIGAPVISLPLPRPCNASVTGKAGATCDGTLRQQALDELLASIREYRAASPAFRPYWRKLAMHRRCADCGTNWADPPSRLCPGCEAYREHMGAAA